MRRIRASGIALAGIAGGCVFGCQSHGHRKFEIEIAGMTFRVEDQTFNDETGKPNYQAGFDKDDSFARWLFGKSDATPVTLAEPEP